MGTRFLPATKANPKEMLPIVDKPLIQYAAEEAISAGIDELIFVTSSKKRAIEDHFDKNYELEAELVFRNKRDLLELVRGVVPSGVSCVYIRQPEALGLGHAVLCARPAVGNEPFAVILADDLVATQGDSCMKQMVARYEEKQGSILGIQEVRREDTNKYGVISPSEVDHGLYRVDDIVEKPDPSVAPSNLAVVGRYVLSGRIFDLLENQDKGAGGEIQLTDAIARLTREEDVFAYAFDGKRYDCGSKMGYLQATVELALEHPEVSDRFRAYLKHFCAAL